MVTFLSPVQGVAAHHVELAASLATRVPAVAIREDQTFDA